MLDRKWFIAGGLALAAVALVGLSLLSRGHVAAPQGATPGSNTQRTTTYPAATGVGAGTSGASASSTASAGASAHKAVGSAASKSDAKYGLRKGMSVPKVAADGAKLPSISTPPVHTLAMIDSSKAKAGDRFAITFRPYGLGPSRSFVVRVLTSKPARATADPVALAGRNVLVGKSFAAPVSAGGLYSGELTVSSQGGLLSFVLTSAKRVK